MVFRKLDKERDRYYLLAGMGKSLARKKRRMMMTWAIAVALFVSVILGVVIYLLNTHRP